MSSRKMIRILTWRCLAHLLMHEYLVNVTSENERKTYLPQKMIRKLIWDIQLMSPGKMKGKLTSPKPIVNPAPLHTSTIFTFVEF